MVLPHSSYLFHINHFNNEGNHIHKTAMWVVVLLSSIYSSTFSFVIANKFLTQHSHVSVNHPPERQMGKSTDKSHILSFCLFWACRKGIFFWVLEKLWTVAVSDSYIAYKEIIQTTISYTILSCFEVLSSKMHLEP